MHKLLDTIANILEIETNKISLDTHKNQIKEWDSLKHIQIVVELEETFGVTIPIEEVSEIKSIKDFLKYLKE